MITNPTAEIAAQLRQVLRPEQASVIVSNPEAVRVASSSSRVEHTLEVRRRDVGDFEVAFVVPNRKGSPFEQLFVGPVSGESSVIREVVDFVSDIVNEQVVLAWDSSWLGGGRRFLRVQSLGSAEKCKYAWGLSWAGGLSWERSA
jgi:hypothetical protein